jgi:hypothetical protein
MMSYGGDNRSELAMSALQQVVRLVRRRDSRSVVPSVEWARVVTFLGVRRQWWMVGWIGYAVCCVASRFVGGTDLQTCGVVCCVVVWCWSACE